MCKSTCLPLQLRNLLTNLENKYKTKYNAQSISVCSLDSVTAVEDRKSKKHYFFGDLYASNDISKNRVHVYYEDSEILYSDSVNFKDCLFTNVEVQQIGSDTLLDNKIIFNGYLISPIK